MENVEVMMNILGQKDSGITFDLVIYVKAKEMQWRLPDEFADMVIRMEGFHVGIIYLSLLGKKCNSSGLVNLLIESGVYANGTASILLKGKSYTRGVRPHKLIREAIFHLLWVAFVQWLSSNEYRGIDKDAMTKSTKSCR